MVAHSLSFGQVVATPEPKGAYQTGYARVPGHGDAPLSGCPDIKVAPRCCAATPRSPLLLEWERCLLWTLTSGLKSVEVNLKRVS